MLVLNVRPAILLARAATVLSLAAVIGCSAQQSEECRATSECAQGTCIAGVCVVLGDTEQAPDGDAPDVDVPEGDVPDGDLPDVDVPDLDMPETDVTEVDAPNLDVPEIDTPDLDVPDVDVPDVPIGSDTDRPDVPMPSDADDVDASDTEVGWDTETDADATPDAEVWDSGGCEGDFGFRGQIGAGATTWGGEPLLVVSRREFAYPNGNLDDLLELTVPNNESLAGLDVPLTDVTVVATSFVGTGAIPRSNFDFWVADSNGAYRVRLNPNTVEYVPNFEIRVGHRISMRVTKVYNFNGLRQIEAATDWRLVSQDNGVYVLTRGAGWPVTVADIGDVVGITGRLRGDGEMCGGSSRCWQLEYGGPTPLTYRSASATVLSDTCVSYVGPVGAIAGTPQLDVVNFDWSRTVE